MLCRRNSDSQSHQLGEFLDMSASVSIDKLCLATLDEFIDHMDADDRLVAMRELDIGGECVQPNHYFQQYLHAADPVVVFLQSWVPAMPLHDVEVVDSNSSDHHVDVVDSNNDSCDANRDGTTS